jgi:glutaminyl-peptide cyclotransferase
MPPPKPSQGIFTMLRQARICERASRLTPMAACVGIAAFLVIPQFGSTHPSSSAKTPSFGHVPEYTFELVRKFPHDPKAFTQGFVYDNGFFYEGTGLEGQSSLRKVNIETGEVVRKADLDPQYFGEGIAIVGDKIYQLTWKSHIAFVYNLIDFRFLRNFSYPGEGWGLASNGGELYLSDGSADIRVLGPDTFAEKRRIHVHDGPNPIEQLNELEFVEGEIFANIWHSNRIARISPQTGKVVGWIDLTGLMNPSYRLPPEAVLNGIAYDRERKRLFVTGKLWPTVFEIKIVPKHGN